MRKNLIIRTTIIICIFFLFGCTLSKDIGSDYDTKQHQETNVDNGEIRNEYKKPIPTNKKIRDDIADQLNGIKEDESLRISVYAELENELPSYKTTIVIQNITSKSMDLIMDCGSIYTIDNVPPSNDNICPAVHSMGFKANGEETITTNLPIESFNKNGNSITVRYEQGNKTKELTIALHELEKVFLNDQ
ncbi:hypothetical protein [Bacillus solimangrovi]|uniref:Uncharacterized protein n=1 Tax=Bacillus solimangrovi TaxID=1305675 RepID=A0A1E5LE38_9BACI|nr:hypothetical protein [Bacillus solimangrovi]OEH92348.1 hypothetical protein BFG57_16365 [Bacillus solimangrovi]